MSENQISAARDIFRMHAVCQNCNYAKYHNNFKISPVTNKNAPHIKVVKKNLFPSSLDREPSLSSSFWGPTEGSESLESWAGTVFPDKDGTTTLVKVQIAQLAVVK